MQINLTSVVLLVIVDMGSIDSDNIMSNAAAPNPAPATAGTRKTRWRDGETVKLGKQRQNMCRLLKTNIDILKKKKKVNMKK